jgi:hypothetical protein
VLGGEEKALVWNVGSYVPLALSVDMGRAGPYEKKERKAPQTSMSASWDFRSHCSYSTDDAHVFMTMLTPYFSKWAFQLEKCPETGNLHWQGRGLLIKRLRAGKAAAQAAELMRLQYFEPTHASVYLKGGFNYVVKAESRVAGPWTESDPPKFKTSDVVHLENVGLLPWQERVLEILAAPVCPRTVHWIADARGNNKKSAFEQLLHFRGLAFSLPYYDAYEKFMQYAYGFASKNAYVVNIVRSINGYDEKQRNGFGMFLGAVERLKDGVVVDGRNVPRAPIMMNRPHVLIFANNLPLLDKASLDRWTIYNIVDGELVDVTLETMTRHSENSAAGKERAEKTRLMAEYRFRESFSKYKIAAAAPAL